MFERLTDRARRAMATANLEASALNHEYIGTEHILLALAREDAGTAADVLRGLGIDLKRLRAEILAVAKPGVGDIDLERLPQTPRAKRAIEGAIMEARGLGHSYVGTEHLLLGLFYAPNSVGPGVLARVGVTLAASRDELVRQLGLRGPDQGGAATVAPMPEGPSAAATPVAAQRGSGFRVALAHRANPSRAVVEIWLGRLLCAVVTRGANGDPVFESVGYGADILSDFADAITRALAALSEAGRGEGAGQDPP